MPLRPIFATYDEGSLSRESIKAGLRVVTVCGCMAFVWMAIAIGMPLTMFMEAIGATGVQIGLIVTVQQIPLILQVPGALLVERLPARKRLWFIMVVSHRMLWLLVAMLPFALGAGQVTVWTLIAIVAASSILAQVASPIWLGWMADLVPKDISARFWGTRQAAMTFAFIVAVWLSGWALDVFKARNSLAGFGILFAIAALVGSLDIAVHLLVPEPKPKAHPPGMSLAEKFKAVFSQRDFVWLTAAMGAWYFGMALIGVFGPVCMKREFGFTYSHISVYIAAGALGAFLSSIPLGMLGDRFGARTIAALIMFFGPLVMASWFFAGPGELEMPIPFLGTYKMPRSMAVMIIPQFIGGGLYAGIGLYQMHLAGLLSKREGRTLSMAVHWSVIGALSTVSPLIGGAVMDFFSRNPSGVELPAGAQLNFYHVLIVLHVGIAWMGALCMLKISIRGGDLSMMDVFRLLRSGNPFRAVMGAYGLAFSPRTPSGKEYDGRGGS